jgi:RNA 2',3'-cyclic 3'-phosphodiesterase
MRLFVAITPPADAMEEMEALAAPLRAAWPRLRWTGPAEWHVTLAFLGEVDAGVLPGLGTRLERAARRHPVLQLSVTGAGTFPGARRARVLWAGIRGDRKELAALAASAAAGARRAGAPPPDEGRRYHPHLTLARCREPADLSPLADALGDLAGVGWAAAEIHLISSSLGAAGRPRYEIIGSWPLRPAAPRPASIPASERPGSQRPSSQRPGS